MQSQVHVFLEGWDTFYVIAGSVAGALIGLQFVVIALVADSSRRATAPEIAAFGTPNVLHFCAALLVSALVSIPWHSLAGFLLAVAACGIGGLSYVAVVIRRARSTTAYRPELEDWVWHAVLPFIAYLSLLVAVAFLGRYAPSGMGFIAGATLGLVFIGIHNAWDTITYIATGPDHGVK